MKSYKKSTKHDPFYLLKKFQVSGILAKESVILMKDPNSGAYFKRHPNDLKRVNKDITINEEKIKR